MGKTTLVPEPSEKLSPISTLRIFDEIRIEISRCRLVVAGGPQVGTELLSERENIRIGTEQDNDLVLSDRTVSRRHCEIHHTARGWLLVDLGSTNGTLIDGKPAERVFLSSGSHLLIGQTPVTFAPVTEVIEITPDREGRLGRLIGRSAKMRQLFGLVRKVAPFDISILVRGETGTGKELVARAVHEESRRSAGPFVVLDCGAVAPTLIESEIFGHEKGAFTGATAARAGAFERACGGTIFIDEVAELRLDLQPRLLRVLENREVRRVGGNATLDVDVRVVAATHRDLREEVKAGRFREDLYYRLSVVEIALPPLRQRREDIPVIAEALLADSATVARHGRKHLSARVVRAFAGYAWPGNVRELVNVVSHGVALSEGPEIDLSHVPEHLQGAPPSEGPVRYDGDLPYKDARQQLLEAFERDYVSRVLQRCGGNLSEAARQSGLNRKSIERLARKYSFR